MTRRADQSWASAAGRLADLERENQALRAALVRIRWNCVVDRDDSLDVARTTVSLIRRIADTALAEEPS